MVCIFFVFKISDSSLFFMQQLRSIPPPAQKSHPLFSSNLSLKIEILPGPFFGNLVGYSIPQETGGTHYVSRSFFKKMVNVLLRSHLTFLLYLDILSLMNNNYTFDGLRRVCKQKTEMYTTWQIGWLPVQGTWLSYKSQSVTWGSMWPTGQTSNNYSTN